PGCARQAENCGGEARCGDCRSGCGARCPDSEARAEEEGQKAELLRDTNIAEATKEKELKVASFKREQDQAKAEADQAYHIQEARSKQQVTEEQMKIELVRKQKEIELEEKEIQRRERQYDAEVKKKADADRYAV